MSPTNDQLTNEPLSSTLHAVNTPFIRYPSTKFPIRPLIFLRIVNRKNYQKLFFSSLICPLQMTNDIEPLSLTLHGVNGHFIDPPQMVKITKSAIVRTADKIFKNKKNLSRRILFDTFVATYGPKFLIAYASHEFELFFFEKLSLNGL